MNNEQSVKDILDALKRANSARFLIGGIATWRITEILLDEDAPFELAKRLRDNAAIYAPDSPLILELHKALSCPWCLSVWVGWIVALFQGDKGWLLTGFAYSAIAIFLVTARKGIYQWLVQSQRRS